MFWLCSLAITLASASSSLSQTMEPERKVRNGPDLQPWLFRKAHQRQPSTDIQCAHSSCHTVLRDELVETENRECGMHNHVYRIKTFEFVARPSCNNCLNTFTNPWSKEPRVKMLLFLHRHYCFFDVQSVCCAISERCDRRIIISTPRSSKTVDTPLRSSDSAS